MRATVETSDILGDESLASATAGAATDGGADSPNMIETNVDSIAGVVGSASDGKNDATGVGSVVNGSTGGATAGPPAAVNGEVPNNEEAVEDVPMPTSNGGYTHTRTSRAKISAANKGKTPWNKGVARSEEVKARIAAGVRARNRERLLAKIAELGLTEEEYNEQKKQEKRKREAERRARRTEKGGYRPTEETKKKISAVLKEKWARGEVKKRVPAGGARRKGFKHSEATKEKIRESLRRRWADDPEYRARKEESAKKVNSGADARQRIANTLKKKWEDPEFRAYMMERMAKRKKPAARVGNSHREKISQAMKKKWQDKAYREKALAGMKKKAEESPRRRPSTSKKKKKVVERDGVYAVSPSSTVKKKKKVIRKKRVQAKKNADGTVVKRTTRKKKAKVPSGRKEALGGGVGEREEPLEEGSLARLRQERRDLYDLLYGDDADLPGATEAAIYDRQSSSVSSSSSSGSGSAGTGLDRLAGGVGSSSDPREPVFSPSLPSYSWDDDDDDDDENLDNFDPYGLEDF